jgi:uncharacterized membrane protein
MTIRIGEIVVKKLGIVIGISVLFLMGGAGYLMRSHLIPHITHGELIKGGASQRAILTDKAFRL